MDVVGVVFVDEVGGIGDDDGLGGIVESGMLDCGCGCRGRSLQGCVVLVEGCVVLGKIGVLLVVDFCDVCFGEEEMGIGSEEEEEQIGE